MAFTLTPYVPDDEICSQLRMFFPLEQQWTIDFANLLSQAVDRGEYYTLDIMKRKFKIHKITGSVTEVE